MNEQQKVETVEREDLTEVEDLRSALTSDRLVRPQKRAFPNTKFTTDSSETVEVFRASDSPVFELDHSREHIMEPEKY
ncbi:MAG: hypothetical protein ABEJ87_02970 [Candidatus Nanohalobium sp.]